MAWETHVVGVIWEGRTGRTEDRRCPPCLIILRYILGMGCLAPLLYYRPPYCMCDQMETLFEHAVGDDDRDLEALQRKKRVGWCSSRVLRSWRCKKWRGQLASDEERCGETDTVKLVSPRRNVADALGGRVGSSRDCCSTGTRIDEVYGCLICFLMLSPHARNAAK